MTNFLRDTISGPAGLAKLAFRVFVGFGLVMVVGGIALTLSDPGGIALIAFGLVFIGAGYLARRVFTPPEGMKAVAVKEDAFTARRHDGLHSAQTQSAVIHVPEDASPEEIEAAKRKWASEQFEQRPDWTEGRVLAESERRGGLHRLAAIVWTVFALGALAAALFWGDIAWLVLIGASVIAGGLSFLAIRDMARARKFGRSLFLMEETPARLGQPLKGNVQTSMPSGRPPKGGFRLTLSCIRRWEESTGDHSSSPTTTRFRSETVWRTTADSRPAVGENGRLAAPVRIDIPDDLPATTLSQRNEGVFWELEIAADAKGADYGARFVLPVLAPDDAAGR